MSDDRIETRIVTAGGEISFQEYFVRERWAPEVKRVFFAGIDRKQTGAARASSDWQRCRDRHLSKQSGHKHWADSCRAGDSPGLERSSRQNRRCQSDYRAVRQSAVRPIR